LNRLDAAEVELAAGVSGIVGDRSGWEEEHGRDHKHAHDRRLLAQGTTSAAGPTMREKWGTTSWTLTWAHQAMSSSSPAGP
jgi:hypothetical protein